MPLVCLIRVRQPSTLSVHYCTQPPAACFVVLLIAIGSTKADGILDLVFQLLVPTGVGSGPSACGRRSLQPLYQWTTLTYATPPGFVPDPSFNNSYAFITGLATYKSMLILSTSRKYSLVPSTLNTVPKTASSSGSSPTLQPYPDISWHMLNGNSTDCNKTLVSVSKAMRDKCNRLWAIDSGNAYSYKDKKTIDYCQPKLVVFDLETNKMVPSSNFPEVVRSRTGFTQLREINDDLLNKEAAAVQNSESLYRSEEGNDKPPPRNLFRTVDISAYLNMLSADDWVKLVTLPSNVLEQRSRLFNLAIDNVIMFPGRNGSTTAINTCDNVFVYLADTIEPAIISYGSQNNTFYRFKHPTMYFDPAIPYLTADGENFTTFNGITGLTVAGSGGERYVYYSALNSYQTYKIPTSTLQQPNNFQDPSEIPVSEAFRKPGPGISLFYQQSSNCILFNPTTNGTIVGYNLESQSQSVLATNRTLLRTVFSMTDDSENSQNVYLADSRYTALRNKAANRKFINARILLLSQTT